ncbi:EAL domain-containing protein [Carnobacterium gallinarum]|uniref:bifunctional diguanylate cyclase/phosphodiesterase n=1 Tax=Carnobacterium gallinarum TaxID=2749 RepID=UPI0005590958|nr:EAL domain-containing protein [Carnobacterium gallinarum]
MQISTYIPIFVICTYLIALFTIFNIVSINHFLIDKNPFRKNSWIILKAVMLSIGIGSIQYIGLVSYYSKMHLVYQSRYTWIAWLILLVCCYITLLIISKKNIKRKDLILGSLLLTSGMLNIRYLGIRGILDKTIAFNPLFLISFILLYFVLSYFTLWLILRQDTYLIGKDRFIQDSKNAFILSIVISILHGFSLWELRYFEGLAFQPIIGEHTLYFVIIFSFAIIMLQLSFLGLTIISYLFDSNYREINKLKNMSYSLLKSHPNPIGLLKINGEVLILNDAAKEVFNIMDGLEMPAIMDFLSPKEYQRAKSYFLEAAEKHKNVQFETKIIVGKEQERISRIQMVPVIFKNVEVTEIFVMGTDVTAENQMEKMIRSLTYHDGLTHLPNRHFMKEYIEDCLKELKKRNNERNMTSLSIYYIDVNELKKINDNFGHQIGDHYLAELAKRIQKYIGKEYFLARVGGDEFVLTFLEEYEGETETVGENLLKVFKRMIVIDKVQIHPTASIGLVKAYHDGSKLDDLLTKADIAMFSAKQHVRKTGETLIVLYSEYEKELQNEYQRELVLMKGIENREFLLHYQPKVYAETGKLYGVEALIRWQVPGEDGLRYPDEFIDFAEKTGHIIQLSEQIVEMVCQQIKKWRDEGHDVPISLNLSANHFQEEDVVVLIEKQIAAYQIPPHLLELEITETVLMENVTKSKGILHQLHDLGIQLSIDDFGTGYSSLRYLIDFPIQSLKIDRSFTNALNENEKVAAVTKSIIQLAQQLDLQVIVEGVETHEQLMTLFSMGNFIIQGYYFSKPVSADEIESCWF